MAKETGITNEEANSENKKKAGVLYSFWIPHHTYQLIHIHTQLNNASDHDINKHINEWCKCNSIGNFQNTGNHFFLK